VAGGITVANAPISYGAFELTVGIDSNVPDGEEILDQVSAAGYAGIDLGPVGYLGTGSQLGERLAARNLGLAGAYLEIPYADAVGRAAMLPELDAMLDTFDEVDSYLVGPRPRPTLADAGSDYRRNNPGRAWQDRSMGMDEEAWDLFISGLSEVVKRCRDRGYEPTFHHETGTFIEAPWEVERLLESSDIGLCLDTGHFCIGGGDPASFLRTWRNRINHVHIKDATKSVMSGIVADGQPTMSIWSREAFPALGQGDVDVSGIVSFLIESNFDGWLVVEQDILPQTAERFARAASDQRDNREVLRGLGV
jgi:inosose dehydratase